MQKMDCTTQELQIRCNERVSGNPLHKWIAELFMRQHRQLSVINWMREREREACRNWGGGSGGAAVRSIRIDLRGNDRELHFNSPFFFFVHFVLFKSRSFKWLNLALNSWPSSPASLCWHHRHLPLCLASSSFLDVLSCWTCIQTHESGRQKASLQQRCWFRALLHTNGVYTRGSAQGCLVCKTRELKQGCNNTEIILPISFYLWNGFLTKNFSFLLEVSKVSELYS